MAGGPIAVTDYPNAHDLTFFQNEELLALQKDGFVGQPYKRDLWGDRWRDLVRTAEGRLLGRRSLQPRSVCRHALRHALTDRYPRLVEGSQPLAHEDEGTVSGTISAEIPAHGCKILKLTKL